MSRANSVLGLVLFLSFMFFVTGCGGGGGGTSGGGYSGSAYNSDPIPAPTPTSTVTPTPTPTTSPIPEGMSRIVVNFQLPKSPKGLIGYLYRQGSDTPILSFQFSNGQAILDVWPGNYRIVIDYDGTMYYDPPDPTQFMNCADNQQIISTPIPTPTTVNYSFSWKVAGLPGVGIPYYESGTVYVPYYNTGEQRIGKFDTSGNHLGDITSPNINKPISVKGNSSYFFVASQNKITRFNKDWTNPGDIITGLGEEVVDVAVTNNSLAVLYIDGPDHRIRQSDNTGSNLGDWTYGWQNPSGVAFGSDGKLYVTNTFNDHILVFPSVAGGTPTVIGSEGSGNGFFENPVGICVSGASIFIADTLNYRFQNISTSGTYQGKFGTQGAGDGQFNCPYGICVDANGDVYVTDSINRSIQKFERN